MPIISNSEILQRFHESIQNDVDQEYLSGAQANQIKNEFASFCEDAKQKTLQGKSLIFKSNESESNIIYILFSLIAAHHIRLTKDANPNDVVDQLKDLAIRQAQDSEAPSKEFFEGMFKILHQFEINPEKNLGAVIFRDHKAFNFREKCFEAFNALGVPCLPRHPISLSNYEKQAVLLKNGVDDFGQIKQNIATSDPFRVMATDRCGVCVIELPAVTDAVFKNLQQAYQNTARLNELAQTFHLDQYAPPGYLVVGSVPVTSNKKINSPVQLMVVPSAAYDPNFLPRLIDFTNAIPGAFPDSPVGIKGEMFNLKNVGEFNRIFKVRQVFSNSNFTRGSNSMENQNFYKFILVAGSKTGLDVYKAPMYYSCDSGLKSINCPPGFSTDSLIGYTKIELGASKSTPPHKTVTAATKGLPISGFGSKSLPIVIGDEADREPGKRASEIALNELEHDVQQTEKENLTLQIPVPPKSLVQPPQEPLLAPVSSALIGATQPITEKPFFHDR